MAQRSVQSYKRSIIRLLISLVALFLLSQLPARSQDGRTSLEGRVEDLTCSGIAGAVVVLANPDNGFQTAAKTGSDGVFRFAMLAPGRYAVTVAAPGMAEVSQAGIELHVGGSMQLQFRLHPAGRAESITVTAPPPLVDPQSGEVSQLIDQQAILDLPLNGRRYTDLALLEPGRHPGPARPDVGVERRPDVRRHARLSEQLPGGRRGQ